MPRVNVLDRKDNMLQMQYMDGFFFPFFPFDSDPHQHVRDIQGLEMRDDDIFIWSYAKCGNHWLWEMIRMLCKGKVEYDQHTKEAHTVDFMTPAMLEKMPSPRPLNCHFLHRHIPQQTFPYNGEFQDFLELYLEGTVPYGSWFDYERSVLESLEQYPDLPVLHVFYEDMKQDCAAELGKVVKFLGLSASDQLCQEVADACEFKKLKAVIKDRPDPLRLSWKEGTEGMCRKGIVGDWKNWFSPEDRKLHDKVMAEKLSGTFLAERYLK